jgi:hypothetical protein
MLTNNLLNRHGGPVDEIARQDRAAADAERRARHRLADRGGPDLPRFPWLAPGLPHDAGTLIRDVLWRANAARDTLRLPEDLSAALSLLAAARSDLDRTEAGLLLVARAEGLTWAQIAEALGLRTAQAGQQRYERVAARLAGEAPADDPEPDPR